MIAGPWTASAPWEVLAVCLLLLVAAGVGTQVRTPAWALAALIGTLVATLFAATPGWAYAAAATGALVHAWLARRASRTGAAMLALSAALALAVAAAVSTGQATTAFLLSCLLVAVRCGALPFHVGVADLCDRAPVVQTQQLASTIALVFVHLRFVDHTEAAVSLAPTIVRYGAVAAIVAGLITIVQRDLRGVYRGTTTMHAGMLMAGLGAASLDNFAAALLVMVAMALALGGLGVTIVSLEERVGPVAFEDQCGRIRAFPRLAASFAFFGGAGVGLPGTAGFVADDLLLHTLWLESPVSAATVVVATALVAVATLIAYSRSFLGRPVTSLAPDLTGGERGVVLVLASLLLALGFVPILLIGPADTFLSPALVTVGGLP